MLFETLSNVSNACFASDRFFVSDGFMDSIESGVTMKHLNGCAEEILTYLFTLSTPLSHCIGICIDRLLRSEARPTPPSPHTPSFTLVRMVDQKYALCNASELGAYGDTDLSIDDQLLIRSTQVAMAIIGRYV